MCPHLRRQISKDQFNQYLCNCNCDWCYKKEVQGEINKQGNLISSEKSRKASLKKWALNRDLMHKWEVTGLGWERFLLVEGRE